MSRFQQVKKQKAKNNHSPLVRAKRREKFFKTGKGSVGILIRRPRVVRVIRKIRRQENERYQALTGVEPKGKKEVLYKGFSETMVGALDAYANRVMEMAAEFAKKRRNNGSKGMKLRVEDIESAKWAIRTVAKQ